MTVVREEQPYPDHPDRFDHCCWQLLAKDALSERSYWEVVWSGRVVVAVTYKQLSRKGRSADCRLGWNDQCWSLMCTEEYYSFWHNKKETVVRPPYGFSVSKRVGVFVDVPTGTLSFYSIFSNQLLHLHTFNISSAGSLYPAFGFGFGCWSYESSVSLVTEEK